MFSTIESSKDLLPIYPSSIQGELRIILQVKDEFLLCFKHLETLRNLWDQQNRIITKEFIIEQIKSGELEIEQLENDLNSQKEMMHIRERHNDALINELRNHGEKFIAETSNRRVKSCRSNLFKSCFKNLNDITHNAKDSTFISVLENIAHRIDSAQAELKENLRPLLEFYKDLFYLQLHFTLALTQISCYCMPLMTDSISLVDRLFFWTERPEFELIKKSGQICDRLRDIYTRLQRILGRLLDSVTFLQDQIDLQRLLEVKFYDKIRQMNQMKDDLLEEIHNTRLVMDLIEEENDRLVGTLIKVDPLFVDREAFALYAEHKNAQSSSQTITANPSDNLRLSRRQSDISQIRNLNSRKSKVKVGPQASETAVTDMFTSKDNLNNTFNVSNANKSSLSIKTKSNQFSSNKINEWRNKAISLLSKMRKTHSKSETNLLEFTNIKMISELQSSFKEKQSNNSKKYIIQITNESTPTSDLNQTTDALVLTSEILPKDD